jgi:type II secretory pathway predicted ATPase ExeA
MKADSAILLKSFEQQCLPFASFIAAKDAIESNLQLFRATGLARNMLVLGEAGTGKSTLCRWLESEHPRSRLPDRDKIEVLLVTVPPAATVGGIAASVLEALEDPECDRGTITSRTARIVTLCKACRVELMLFDESQHLQDRGDTQSHYLIGDWFKNLIDQVAVPTVMLGLPRLEILLQTNEQMRRRFSRRIRLALGQSDVDSVETECLQLFWSLACLMHLPVVSEPYSAQEMGRRLYYASDGRVAYIKKLLFSSLRRALELDYNAIDVELLERAFTDEVWWEGIGKLNPFNPAFELRRLDRRGEPFQVVCDTRRR